MTGTIARPILEIGDVARVLNVSVETIRRWDKAGRIATPERTSSGRRVFTTADVEAIKASRDASQQRRPIAAG